MEGSAVVLALLTVGVFALGLWLGHHHGKAGIDQLLDRERLTAEAREAALREQIGAAKTELAELRPKAEELAAKKQQLENEREKYAQMKADLDAAFKGLPRTPSVRTRSLSSTWRSNNSAARRKRRDKLSMPKSWRSRIWSTR